MIHPFDYKFFLHMSAYLNYSFLNVLYSSLYIVSLFVNNTISSFWDKSMSSIFTRGALSQLNG